jgi:hypothetical protein
MIKDPGPNTNIGFGVTPVNRDTEEGTPEGASFIQRALSKNPVASFLATSAAALVSMHVAGKVVRGGGLRLGYGLQQAAKGGDEFSQTAVQSIRKVREYLDTLEGVERKVIDKNDPSIFVKREARTAGVGKSRYKYFGEVTTKVDSFHFRDGLIKDGDNVEAWTARDAIQQRLVSQARRLPYELPALYLADKAVIQPLFNKDPEKKQVNWLNPVDVLGDFANTSIRNVATAAIPFELGMGYGSAQYNRLMTQGLKTFSSSSGENNLGLVTMRSALSRVGASAEDLLNKVNRYSNQSAGAASSYVDTHLSNGISFTQWAKRMNDQATMSYPVANASFAKKSFNFAREVASPAGLKKNYRTHLNALPGPFKGIGDSLTEAKTNFNKVGKTYDNWQDVISGKRKLADFNLDDQVDVREFMRRGGKTRVEEYATQVFQLGRGGRYNANGTKNPDWRQGNFFQGRSHAAYEDLLVDGLESTGLDRKTASQFIRSASVLKPIKRRGVYTPGEALAERVKFASGVDVSDPNNITDWFAGLKAQGLKAKIEMAGVDESKFRRAVTIADAKFGSRTFQDGLEDQLEQQWNTIHGRVLPKFGGDILTTKRRPYEEFSGSLKSSQRDFLIRRTAQRMGIETIDGAGQKVADQVLRNQLAQRGMDPTKLHSLKGFLTDKGDISKPWSRKGANIFGFQSLSVSEAFQNGFFEGTDPNVRNEISHIINARNLGQNIPDTSKSLRMKGVYKSSSGRVIDIGRIGRSLSKATDKFADEYQIPLLHFNPVTLLGHNVRRDLRNKASIQIVNGSSLQPFMPPGSESADFHLWMRTSKRGSKGKVVSVTGGVGRASPTTVEHSGFYKPFDNDSTKMGGKHVRLAASQMGQEAPGTAAGEGKWRKRINAFQQKMDVSRDQSESLFGLGKRWKQFLQYKQGGADSPGIRNPIRAAQWFASKTDFNPNLTENETFGFHKLFRALNNYGISRNTMRELSAVSTPSGWHAPLALGDDVADISDTGLVSFAKSLIETDAKRAQANPGTKSDDVFKLQQNIRNLLKRGEAETNFFDQSTSQAMRSVGVSRNIDRLRNEIFKYKLVTTELDTSTGQTFNSSIQKLLNDVEGLASKGRISRKELSEARAAVLGVQMEFYSIKGYQNIINRPGFNFGVGVTQPQIAREALGAMLDPAQGAPDFNRRLLGDFAKRNPHSSGRVGALKNLGRRSLGATPYDSGMEFNPFGSRTTLVPTFGTAFERNPVGAVSSVLGFNTWSEKGRQSFSGSSIPVSHMVSRLNRYFETFSMGIDPNRYKGPLDYYARGMVGKRVLPIVAGGTTVTMLDRQLGGMINEDAEGNPIYAPYLMGYGADALKNMQIASAGLVPGGQTAEEKRYELEEGEVPIRAGRFWPLGNTPFKGGRIQYFRPSWYQRFKSGGTFIPEKNETPLERLAFGYDYSPLRPLDPYRFERQNYESRPYPVSGDYFTGPWGPLNGVLNSTVGRVLKPRREMHKEELAYGLQQYAPVGESGAYMSQRPILSSPGQALSGINSGVANTPYSGGTSFYSSMGTGSGRGTASGMVRDRATQIASGLSASAGSGSSGYRRSAPYGVPYAPGTMQPRVLEASPPLNPGSIGVQAGKLGYQSQELMGIYGFASGQLRKSLGFGSSDFTPSQAVLEPASRGYSASRSFWGMNLGGLGDLPLPIEGNMANLEISEIIRRFVPKEQSGINYINPIANTMGKQYPWLPGSNYPINPLKMGDPYGTLPDSEIRLPGTGYNRTHKLYPDQYGQMGIANIHDILADVAPWSPEYKAVDRLVNSAPLSNPAFEKVQQTRAQVDAMRMRNEFTPYRYRYEDPNQVIDNPVGYSAGRAWEWLSHRDTIINTKFLPNRTAVEDWERDNVYGATFPTWQDPVDSFLKPMINKTSQRNPISSALGLGFIGSMFGVTPQAKAVGATVGGTIGLTSSALHNAQELITGDRFIPKDRKKQLALEEYTDILSYTKSVMLASRASQAGDQQAVNFYVNQSKRTMYGADLNSTPEKLAMAIPKRKREHFLSMLYAPEQERKQILSTAGRLERRFYQAAWGMPVEQRPDIPEYFEDHELPSPESEIWSPLLNMDTIKIKVGQSQGIDMAQMGYFPQQIREANLINPSYPNMYSSSSNESVQAQLRRLMFNGQMQGSVQAIPTPYPGTRVQLNAGVY